MATLQPTPPESQWFNSIPAWIAAAAGAVVAAIGLFIATRNVVHWCASRWVLRGSAAAIISLLSESPRRIWITLSRSQSGRLLSSGRQARIMPQLRPMLCPRDLERLQDDGYIHAGEKQQWYEPPGMQYRISPLGEMLIKQHGKGRLFTRSRRRA